ncbi:MAG: hypothetical protein K8R74_15135 [Bacteroidales bacterium]|nr:hypothetical protein [Bacteroidales bacterium]
MRKFLLIIVAIIPFIGIAQEKEKKFGIKFSGFVKTDIFFDSRQTWDARDGQFLLYPKNEMPDENGSDINASTKFNMLSIQTRLKLVITGPDALGAKTSGLIEGAFFGNIGSDLNGFRLRHAFVKLNWEKTELMVGQYWHPMFVTSCFAGTVSFNTGTPFQPFSRNPQVRLTQKLWRFNFILSALTQTDFASTGPDGFSTRYIINSGIPELNFRFEYKSDDFLIGVGSNYKTLMPRLNTTNTYYVAGEEVNKNYKTNQRVLGSSIFAYLKYKSRPLTIKIYGVYGQMMYSMVNLGGYAETEFVKEAIDLSPDSITTNIKYSPLSTASTWIDIHTNGKKWQFGLFGGYSKNLGSNDEIRGKVWGRGADVDYLYRISPRVIFNAGKFRIAPEIEYTVAAYATTDKDTGLLNRDEKGVITGSKEIANLRFLIGVYYFF